MRINKHVLSRNSEKMTALRAAEIAMETRGHVVICIIPGGTAEIDGLLLTFAGGLIPGSVLRIKAATTEEDWDAQLELLGLEMPTRKHPEFKYYTTVLERRHT